MTRLGSVMCAAIFFSITGSATEARAGEPEKRALPDYGGTEPPSCGVCWPARVVLFPVRVVYEALFRQPVGVLVRGLEKEEPGAGTATARFEDVAPTFTIDPGFNARFGLTGTLRIGSTRIRMLADGGAGGYTLGIAPSVGKLDRVGAFATIARRPDAIYAPTGSRVAVRSGEAGFRASGAIGLFSTSASIGVRGAHVGEEMGSPFPIAESFMATFTRLDLALDSTHELPVKGRSIPRSIRTDGVRVALSGEHAATFTGQQSWLAYGGSFLASVDTGKARIFELSAALRLVDPLAGDSVPWTEQPALGGGLLRGHREGRVRGRSTMVYGAQWRWPVWAFLEGFVLGEIGNAFDKHFEGASLKEMRISATAGMRHQSLSGYVFELMSGIGTDTIEERARVSSVRFLFAATMPL